MRFNPYYRIIHGLLVKRVFKLGYVLKLLNPLNSNIMEPFKIHITDINGKDWGTFEIYDLHWHNNTLYMIQIDWYKEQKGTMPMWDYNKSGEFVNQHGNILGKIITP